jgi:Flp pilus assembly protein CpaB
VPSISLREQVFSSRRGTLAVGILAAALAAILLLVYLNRYRQNVNQNSAPVAVLVAKNLIPKGTPGDVIGSKVLFQATTVPRAQLKDGALSDPSALSGQVAVADIFPGQQLTAGSFSELHAGAIATQLSGFERAVSIPVDSTHGMIGQAQVGDHVDVLVGLNSSGLDKGPVQGAFIKTILRDIPILATSGSSLTLRVDDAQAGTLAWASDNGKVWVTLRPPIDARQTHPRIVSLTSVVAGGPR